MIESVDQFATNVKGHSRSPSAPSEFSSYTPRTRSIFFKVVTASLLSQGLRGGQHWECGGCREVSGVVSTTDHEVGHEVQSR